MKSVFVCTTLFCCAAAASVAQDPHAGNVDSARSHHSHGLHFSHPLVAESVSPDTKIRLEYEFEHFRDDEGDAQTIAFEGEYAFHPSFSVEVGIPTVIVNPTEASSRSDLGSIEVALKFANRAFSEYGLLLGYGLELGLPTGDDEKGIGSDHLLVYEPFLNAGYKRDDLELIGFAKFGIPTRQEEEEEIETEFEYNFSILYHFTTQIQGLLELDGETALSGGEESVGSITPAIKVRPLKRSGLALGLGVSLPLTDEAEFDARTLFSAFYHF